MVLTDDQVRHLVSDIAVQMLARAVEDIPERRDALKHALSAWLPDADEFDLREVLPRVQTGLLAMATLVEERLDRLVKKGGAARYVRR